MPCAPPVTMATLPVNIAATARPRPPGKIMSAVGDGQPGLTYPSDWEDEDRMHYLLGPFSPSVVSSLSLTHPKVQFWSSLVISACHVFRQPVFTEHQMLQRLQWRDQTPSCLQHVLTLMEKSGRLCAVRNEERTREGVSGWMSWSVSVLRDSVSWVWKGNQNSANQMYVDTYLLQELAEFVLKQLQMKVEFRSTDQLITGTQLRDLCIEMIDISAISAVESELVRQRKIVCKISSKGLKVVKFSMPGDSLLLCVSEMDEGILSLKENIISLQKHISSLTKTMERLKRMAKDNLKQKQKQLAINNMHRSRQTQQMITSKSTMLGNMQTILHQIQMAESDCLVLEAYHKGNEVLKSIYSEYDIARAEDIIDELHEVLQVSKEVGMVLGERVVEEDEVTDEELEKELKTLFSDPDTIKEAKRDDDSSLATQLSQLELISPPTKDLPDITTTLATDTTKQIKIAANIN